MIETEVLKRLKGIAKRLEELLENNLFEGFYTQKGLDAGKKQIVKYLLEISPTISDLEEAKKLKERLETKQSEAEIVKIATRISMIVNRLCNDDQKKVLHEVRRGMGLVKALTAAIGDVRVASYATEMLWFVYDGAPVHRWSDLDDRKVNLWNFSLVKTETEFDYLVECGKIELTPKEPYRVRLCFGTKSVYILPEEKDEIIVRFKAMFGEEEYEANNYQAGIELLFPDKFTTGNYFVYVP